MAGRGVRAVSLILVRAIALVLRIVGVKGSRNDRDWLAEWQHLRGKLSQCVVFPRPCTMLIA
jgi:hypothetical protein